jgi:rsbT co-antagonist protein RsbR
MSTTTAQRTAAHGIPELDFIDPGALRDFWTVYEERYEDVNEASRGSFVNDPEFGPLMASMTSEQVAEQNVESRSWMRRAIVDGDWDEYVEYLGEQGTTFAAMGISFGGWFRVMGTVRPFLRRYLFEAFAEDRARLEAALGAMNGFFDLVMRIIGERYLAAMEKTIHQQQDAIRELSTPVLELSEGLLLLPIVGVVDSHRAHQMTEQLLNAIRTHRAKVVVVDITGVPAVDTMVANHLVQATEAARLLGAASIVTGLSAEVAQTMVKIGINLSGLHTVGNLRGGIVEANRIIGS